MVKRPTNSWDPLASLGHSCKFQLFSHLGSITARHSSSGRQPNFAALKRGCHLYSAGRSSRWASAHILVIYLFMSRQPSHRGRESARLSEEQRPITSPSMPLSEWQQSNSLGGGALASLFIIAFGHKPAIDIYFRSYGTDCRSKFGFVMSAAVFAVAILCVFGPSYPMGTVACTVWVSMSVSVMLTFCD